MPSKPELSIFQKELIIDFRNKGYSYSKIACITIYVNFSNILILVELGISKSCAHITVKNAQKMDIAYQRLYREGLQN